MGPRDVCMFDESSCLSVRGVLSLRAVRLLPPAAGEHVADGLGHLLLDLLGRSLRHGVGGRLLNLLSHRAEGVLQSGGGGAGGLLGAAAAVVRDRRTGERKIEERVRCMGEGVPWSRSQGRMGREGGRRKRKRSRSNEGESGKRNIQRTFSVDCGCGGRSVERSNVGVMEGGRRGARSRTESVRWMVGWTGRGGAGGGGDGEKPKPSG